MWCSSAIRIAFLIFGQNVVVLFVFWNLNSVKPRPKPSGFDGSSNRIPVKMSFLILGRRSTQLSRIPTRELFLFSCSFSSQSPNNSISNYRSTIFYSWYNSSNRRNKGFSSIFNGRAKNPSGSIWGVRFLSSEAAVEPTTADGLTVEGIIAKNWNILDDSEDDWKSHASSIAQSVHLIKKRLKVFMSIRNCCLKQLYTLI